MNLLDTRFHTRHHRNFIVHYNRTGAVWNESCNEAGNTSAFSYIFIPELSNITLPVLTQVGRPTPFKTTSMVSMSFKSVPREDVSIVNRTQDKQVRIPGEDITATAKGSFSKFSVILDL